MDLAILVQLTDPSGHFQDAEKKIPFVLFGLKQYLFYERQRQALLNKANLRIEELCKSNLNIKRIYNNINVIFLKNWDEFKSNSTKIKTLFELSQKKMILPFILQDKQIIDFI